jgi:nucleotide-binding universal stress UspA family protein
MGKILCATRGGEAGILTQIAAIARAKETNDALVFLYIYDMEFLAHANYVLNPDVVSDELDHMAEFLMTMAVERAKQKGIQASYLIRQGDFDSELASVAKEEEATLVILGRPGDEESRFALENLKELAERLQTETGIEFCVLPEP